MGVEVVLAGAAAGDRRPTRAHWSYDRQLPSTVVHTLPTVLAEVGAEVVVCEIAKEWYEPEATLGADDFLGRVTTSARRIWSLQPSPASADP